MIKLYTAKKLNILTDLFWLLISYYAVLDWFPLTTEKPFEKYSLPTLIFTIAWVILSYLFGRYKSYKRQKYYEATLRLLYVSEIVFVVFALLVHFVFTNFSGFVLLSITLGAFIVNYAAISIYFIYRFAVEYYDSEVTPIVVRENAQVKPATALDIESLEQLRSTIQAHCDSKILEFMENEVNLQGGNTLVFVSNDAENLKMYPNYQYSAMIQLERLNNMRGINAKLTIINEKLSDDGLFICCFETKSTRKKRILKRYIPGLNYIIYSVDYIFKRVVPKIFITRRLYYFITNGKNRIFSKTEVFGRLYCFGFKVIKEKKSDDLTWVIAQRLKQPEPAQKRFYGPLIRLRRFGKLGKPFEVYKMRTMHPYSEYLQGYIFERNNLKEGGKFNKDIRVTTIGGIMRKYWLDELPMLINLFKGEMKLVGVRPLSAHYYGLYTKELQDKRNQFKPGLLPPFYADMPKTLDEIQQSEMNYLIACEKSGTFITDLKYLLRILKNILFKKARSA